MSYSRRQLFGFFGSTAKSAAAAVGIHARTEESSAAAEAYESALEILAPTGPEYGSSGLSNHGPMVAEALVALGRPDEVRMWIESYRRRLEERPRPSDPISGRGWRAALGDYRRAGDWALFFRRTLAENPWPQALAEWTGHLAPGASTAAFHGLIRTAHAARALSRRDTPLRRAELAEGLAYWAARYRELPNAPDRSRRPYMPSAALEDVERLPPGTRGESIANRLERIGSMPAFARVAESADVSGDVSRFLSELTDTFARVYTRRVTDDNVIALVHAITGSSAVRLLIPWTGEQAARDLARFAWQGAAAIYAGYGGGPDRPGIPDAGDLDRDTIVERAVATRDEHAIKLAEACFRENTIDAHAAYLAVARDAGERLAPG